MSQKNGLKFLILIWCICLLTKLVYLSSINKNYQNDEETTNKLKNILLRKLDFEDLPTNPDPIGDTNVPNYLLELFETNSLFENNRILLLKNSNTIRSHPLFDQSSINQPLISKSNKSGFIIKFNLTLPSKEVLNAGEFRLFMNNSINLCASNKQRITINQIINQQLVNYVSNRNQNLTANSFFKKSHFYQLFNEYTTQKDEDNLIYRQIDSLSTEQDESKWLQFDILPAIESWISKSSTNFGLLIKSNCINQNDLNLNEDQFIDNLIFDSISFDEQLNNLKPVLLTYSSTQNLDYELDNLDFLKKKKRHINQNEKPLTGVHQPNSELWKNGKTKECARYSMIVNFQEIGWDSWIVTPKSYNAFFCYGDCSLSVIRNSNLSNHATMQSLSNGIQPDIVPPPCCVPTEFMPISMIYKDHQKDTAVLKIYEDMIVTSCGCK